MSTPSARIRQDPELRFWRHVDKTGPGGCWIWTGAVNHAGYGLFTADSSQNGTQFGAHRHAYIFTHGSIPDGLALDHLCRVRSCVNPDHLEPVTDQVNTLRGVGPSAENARKTHCKWGHEFTPENTGDTGRGGRFCKTCQRETKRRVNDKLKAERAFVPATHCQRGHEFTPENTGRTPRGCRFCRICQRAAGQRYRNSLKPAS